MYINVTESMFIDLFKATRPYDFSAEALRELFDWHEQLEIDTGESLELDVIGICCTWAELTQAELIRQYAYIIDEYDIVNDDGTVPTPDSFDDEAIQALTEVLDDETFLIEVDGYDEITYLVHEF